MSRIEIIERLVVEDNIDSGEGKVKLIKSLAVGVGGLAALTVSDIGSKVSLAATTTLTKITTGIYFATGVLIPTWFVILLILAWSTSMVTAVAKDKKKENK